MVGWSWRFRAFVLTKRVLLGRTASKFPKEAVLRNARRLSNVAIPFVTQVNPTPVVRRTVFRRVATRIARVTKIVDPVPMIAAVAVVMANATRTKHVRRVRKIVVIVRFAETRNAKQAKAAPIALMIASRANVATNYARPMKHATVARRTAGVVAGMEHVRVMRRVQTASRIAAPVVAIMRATTEKPAQLVPRTAVRVVEMAHATTTKRAQRVQEIAAIVAGMALVTMEKRLKAARIVGSAEICFAREPRIRAHASKIVAVHAAMTGFVKAQKIHVHARKIALDLVFIAAMSFVTSRLARIRAHVHSIARGLVVVMARVRLAKIHAVAEAIVRGLVVVMAFAAPVKILVRVRKIARTIPIVARLVNAVGLAERVIATKPVCNSAIAARMGLVERGLPR